MVNIPFTVCVCVLSFASFLNFVQECICNTENKKNKIKKYVLVLLLVHVLFQNINKRVLLFNTSHFTMYCRLIRKAMIVDYHLVYGLVFHKPFSHIQVTIRFCRLVVSEGNEST